MAKEKKAKKGDQPGAAKPKQVKAKKAKVGKAKRTTNANPLEALSKIADHPLVAELIAAGALAAVAAVADATSKDPAAAKSAASAKKAGKAAAAAIGARLLKEFSSAATGVKKASAPKQG